MTASRRAGLLVSVVAVASFLVRVFLGTRVHGPWVFSDELGYQRVAFNIAHSGRFALYGKSSFSYSPLYPAALSPIYALVSSPERAYEWVKVVNAALMSAALVPTYAIARYVVGARQASAVVVMAAGAPLMYTAAAGMSESLAYPVFVTTVWLLLRALTAPSVRNDAILLLAIVVAAATRTELVVLLPAALGACGVLGALDGDGHRLRAAFATLVNRHRLLTAGSVAALAAAALPALFGHSPAAAAGRYSQVPGQTHQHLLRPLVVLVYHSAGMVILTGVVPLVGTLVAASAFDRRRASAGTRAFVAVAAMLTGLMLVETALAASAFEAAGDPPFVYERYLFYLVPFFLVGLVAAAGRRDPERPLRLYVKAVIPAAVAVLLIPYRSVMGGAMVAESYSFALLANDRYRPIAGVAAVAAAGVVALGLALAALRGRLWPVTVLALAIFMTLSVAEGRRMEALAGVERATMAGRPLNWVERLHVPGPVVLVAGAHASDNPFALWQTDYYNPSISRLYYTCKRTLSSDFGERRVTNAADGELRAAGTPIAARYAVVPSGRGVLGRVVARDPTPGLDLVAVKGGVLRIDPRFRARWSCGGAR